MPEEFHPESIRFTSDSVGFNGFRALVRELPDEGEVDSGRRGLPRFSFACRPVREKGRTLLTFQEDSEMVLPMNRISTIIPPDKPCSFSLRNAAGIVGHFEVHPRFLEETLCRAGFSRFRSMPPPRFVINRRVDWCFSR
jgi:hypothetical protein